MRIHFHQAALPLLLSLCAVGSAAADTIYLTNGSEIADVRVSSEGLLKTEYRESKGNKNEEIDSDRILRIEYTRMPALLDKAEQDLRDDLMAGAVEYLEEYVGGVEGAEQKKFPWAPAYAMFRLIELREAMGESAKVVEAADRLITHAPESRYVPMALLKKAEALADKGDAGSARGTIAELQALVSSKGLSKLWSLECQVRDVMFDSSAKGSAKRSKLEDLVSETEPYPVVRNRVLVALGESWLEAKKFKEAEDIFKVVTADANADGRTLAAAYMGLGDCQYQRGSDSKDPKVLNEALMNYMRIVVSHKNELRYVPRAMFQAGRVFQTFETPETEERAQKLYTRLMRNFKGNRWADEARGFRK